VDVPSHAATIQISSPGAREPIIDVVVVGIGVPSTIRHSIRSTGGRRAINPHGVRIANEVAGVLPFDTGAQAGSVEVVDGPCDALIRIVIAIV
jgi:hypothetical protein